MLAEYLLELKDTGVLRANHVCILHYWSHYAGAAGPVERLKVLPDSVSGNFHKHLDKVRDTPKDNGPFYNLKIATFSSKDGRRIEATAPAVPLKNDMNSMQDPSGLLQHMRRENSLPPSYYDHESVLANPATDVPVCCSIPPGVHVALCGAR